MSEFEIRYAYGPRRASVFHTGDDTKVQQNLRDQTDINRIMAKYNKTGILDHVSKYAGDYGDFSGVPDYRTALDKVASAQEMFMELPAVVRDRFGNDPAKFIEFATDPKNIDEMRSLGLAPQVPAPPEPQLVKVVQEPEADDKSASKKPSPDPEKKK